MYQSHKIEGNKVRVSFSHIGQGLGCRPADRLQGFAVAQGQPAVDLVPLDVVPCNQRMTVDPFFRADHGRCQEDAESHRDKLPSHVTAFHKGFRFTTLLPLS